MASRGWGPWSDWAVDTEGRRYRVRYDAYGTPEWEQGDDHADLVQSFQNVNLGGDQDHSYNQHSQYTYSAPAAVDGGAASMYGASHSHAHGAHYGQEKSREPRSRPQKEVPKGPKKQRQKSSKFHDGAPPVDLTANQPGRDPFYTKSNDASHPPHTSASPETTYGTSPYGPAYTSGNHTQSSGSHQVNYQVNYQTDTHPRRYEEPEPTRPERHSRRGRDSDSETTFSRSTATDEGTIVEAQRSSYYTASDSVVGDVTDHDSVNQELADTISQVDPYMIGDVHGAYSPGESSSMATVSGYPYSEHGLDSGGRDTPKPHPQQSAPSTGAEQYYSSQTMNLLPQQLAPPMAADLYAYPTSPPMSLPEQPAPSTITSAYSYSSSQSMSAASHRELTEHSGYTVHHSSRFRPGAIFKIIWSEPLGTGGPRSEVPTLHQTFENGGQAFYQGLRRFIVVANDEGNCTCVPILTYERQGCNKKGVKPLKHGIIYQDGKSPRMLPGEPKLGFNPVRVILREKTEQLIKESRVNYAKLQTVEHNFRVYFIGKVDPDDFKKIVIPAVDYCWESKWRHNN